MDYCVVRAIVVTLYPASNVVCRRSPSSMDNSVPSQEFHLVFFDHPTFPSCSASCSLGSCTSGSGYIDHTRVMCVITCMVSINRLVIQHTVLSFAVLCMLCFV